MTDDPADPVQRRSEDYDWHPAVERVATREALGLAEEPAEWQGPPLQDRIAGVEQWQRLADGRLHRLERRTDGFFEDLTLMRASAFTKEDWDASRKEARTFAWTVGSVIVALVGALVAAIQLWITRPAAPPPAAPTAAPIIIQVPPLPPGPGSAPEVPTPGS